MKTIKLKIYNFKELNKEAQNKAIENNSDINVDIEGYNDFIIEDILSEIEEKTGLKLNAKHLNYEMFSRSNCMFFESRDIINALYHKFSYLKNINLPTKFGVYTNYLGGGLCSGLNKSELRADIIEFYEIEEEDNLKVMVLKKKQQKEAEEIIKNLNTILEILENGYKELYENYNYLISEEAIKETLIINEYEFLENGDRYYG